MLSKEYGKHCYAEKVYCKHGCGCWIKSLRFGGPIGIDPLGECPKNPLDGEVIGGHADQKIVMARRIKRMEEELSRLKRKSMQLAEELAETKARLIVNERIVRDTVKEGRYGKSGQAKKEP